MIPRKAADLAAFLIVLPFALAFVILIPLIRRGVDLACASE